ncbi:hypothetical protein [Marinobacter caseinilyticus]|uniref:hypothetical protein n=1 Tax=Marinobacter caseinilyticus TaxID=2692195 RepID=UPI00140B4949|nr:hypothetical protein [Marinobacter caseinilyticus]
MDEEGFPITLETYIPYFYSELPYEIRERFSANVGAEKAGFLEVRFNQQIQHHGYWVEESQGWLNSIQFLPTLPSSERGRIDLEDGKRELREMQKRCIFKQ